MRVNKQEKHSLPGAAGAFVENTQATGRVSFALDELIGATGLSPIAARHQLLRLGERVVRVTPRQPYYLIVAPEHRATGAPPVDHWLDDYMRWLGCSYYLALQSAAAAHGSSPQALQETQVMIQQPRRDIVVGRLRIRFFMKSALRNALTQALPATSAPLTVSTPETTVFDLLRYAHNLGGVDRMVETLSPLLPALKPRALSRVLAAENEIATAQRLGYILARLSAETLATAVDAWLPRPRQKILLAQHKEGNRQNPADPRWGVIDNTRSFP